MVTLDLSGHFIRNSRPLPPPRYTLLACLGLTLWLLLSIRRSSTSNPAVSASSHFHVLVAVTSADISICKLILSAVANGYPTPILLNWADKNELGNAQYIDKFEAAKSYLTRLQRQGTHDQDIVLVVGGSDIMIQLGADVLLSNYFETIRSLDEYIQQTYRRPDIRHTILFGADKHCWPGPPTSPACWITPRSPLDPLTYGPYTSSQLSASSSHWSQPRWLNPGTVIGPVADLISMYESVIAHARTRNGPMGGQESQNTEQAHFAELFMLQEQERLRDRPDIVEDRLSDTKAMESGEGIRLKRTSTRRNELHMGLDYHASLFMPLMYEEPFLLWTKQSATRVFTDASPDERKLQSFFDLPLPDALSQSPSPYTSLNSAPLSQLSWSDVNLLRNTATGSVPAIIHFTLHEFRDPWWEKLWFQNQADLFRLARVEAGTSTHLIAERPIDGRLWYTGEHVNPLPLRTNEDMNVGVTGAGAWTAEGKWVTWNDTCGEYEQWLYA